MWSAAIDAWTKIVERGGDVCVEQAPLTPAPVPVPAPTPAAAPASAPTAIFALATQLPTAHFLARLHPHPSLSAGAWAELRDARARVARAAPTHQRAHLPIRQRHSRHVPSPPPRDHRGARSARGGQWRRREVGGAGTGAGHDG